MMRSLNWFAILSVTKKDAWICRAAVYINPFLLR